MSEPVAQGLFVRIEWLNAFRFSMSRRAIVEQSLKFPS